MNYLTMICDIINSHKMKNREEVQYGLIDTLKKANKNFSDIIVSPFLIIVGDEWEGLLNYPCDYNSVISFFHDKMPGINFYCGMGVGEVTVNNFELTVNQLDGPAFYKARKAIGIAKRSKYSLVLIN